MINSFLKLLQKQALWALGRRSKPLLLAIPILLGVLSCNNNNSEQSTRKHKILVLSFQKKSPRQKAAYYSLLSAADSRQLAVEIHNSKTSKQQRLLLEENLEEEALACILHAHPQAFSFLRDWQEDWADPLELSQDKDSAQNPNPKSKDAKQEADLALLETERRAWLDLLKDYRTKGVPLFVMDCQLPPAAARLVHGYSSSDYAKQGVQVAQWCAAQLILLGKQKEQKTEKAITAAKAGPGEVVQILPTKQWLLPLRKHPVQHADQYKFDSFEAAISEGPGINFLPSVFFKEQDLQGLKKSIKDAEEKEIERQASRLEHSLGVVFEQLDFSANHQVIVYAEKLEQASWLQRQFKLRAEDSGQKFQLKVICLEADQAAIVAVLKRRVDACLENNPLSGPDILNAYIKFIEGEKFEASIRLRSELFDYDNSLNLLPDRDY